MELDAGPGRPRSCETLATAKEDRLIVSLRLLILSVSWRLRWLPPLAARVTLGLIFLKSGWGALHILPRVTAYFAELGIPAPGFLAGFVATTELVCGGLLLAGLLTRLASLPLIVTMIVAIATARKAEIHALADLFGMKEYLYAALLLWLGAFGAGRVSLDAHLASRFSGEKTGTPVPDPAAR